MSIAIVAALAAAVGVAVGLFLLRRKVMKMDTVLAALTEARDREATVRAQYQTLTGLVASLQTASSTIIAALQAAGVTVRPEVEAAVRALTEDGKSTLAMLEIMQADADKLSQVTVALMKGARPDGDLSPK
jgi:hypothetical protein